jgi:hypothetical protein
MMSVLPVTMFRLAPANGHLVLAHISGKMRKTFHSPNDAGADQASNEADVSALERKSARVRVTFQEGARRLIG